MNQENMAPWERLYWQHQQEAKERAHAAWRASGYRDREAYERFLALFNHCQKGPGYVA